MNVMKSFLQFLRELAGSDEVGTYIPVYPTSESRQQLGAWVSQNLKLTNPVPTEEYHCTVIYSRKPVPVQQHTLDKVTDQGLTAEPKNWSMFGTNLVLEISSPAIFTLNRYLVNVYNAQSDYDTYRPHITVDTNYTGELPAQLPNFTIHFDNSEIKTLEE